MDASGSKKLIEIRIFGGLGNQLFQYSLGVYLKKMYQLNVFYDCEWYSNPGSNIIRPLDIKAVDPNINVIGPKLILSKYLKNRYLRYLFGQIAKNFILDDKKYTEVIEGKLNDRYIFLNGYWQNTFHVDFVRDDLLRLLTSYTNDSKIFQRYMRDISDSKNSLAIHIRRGDYISPKNSKIYTQLPIDYYYSSISYIKDNFVKHPLIFVFSDDIEWAKKNLKLNNAVFIENIGDTVAELVLMSSAKFNIIANSTFSWWGAYLNNRSECKIAPKKWFIRDDNPMIIGKDWITI